MNVKFIYKYLVIIIINRNNFNFTLFLELKCLQTVLQDHSKAMEQDCRLKLQKRIEMFRNADTVSTKYFFY